MVVLVNNTTGKIIAEGDDVTVTQGVERTGKYTGWMPPHQRNEEGLAYVKFEDKKWDESFLPSYLGCKLIKL